MSDTTVKSENDIEEQHRLAESYQPDLLPPTQDAEHTEKGANISELRSTSELISQYQQHDTYRLKAENLAVTHGQYRKVKGDGNCGWRAMIFAFFELLESLQDTQKLEAEKTRLHDRISQLSEENRELFDGAIELLDMLFQDLIASLNQEQVPSIAFNFFNGDDAAHVVFLFRLLTAAEMRSNENIYAGYLIDTTVDEYCRSVVEMPDQEIEETTLLALASILHRAANFGLEVLMFVDDRGAAVDSVTYCEANPAILKAQHNQGAPPVTCLLFRPTHYDVAYPTIKLMQHVPESSFVETVSHAHTDQQMKRDVGSVPSHMTTSQESDGQRGGFAQDSANSIPQSSRACPERSLGEKLVAARQIQMAGHHENARYGASTFLLPFEAKTSHEDITESQLSRCSRQSPLNPRHFRSPNFDPTLPDTDAFIRNSRSVASKGRGRPKKLKLATQKTDSNNLKIRKSRTRQGLNQGHYCHTCLKEI